jgi:hypothetical protein
MPDFMEVRELIDVLAARGPGCLAGAAKAFLVEETQKAPKTGAVGRMTRVVPRVDLDAESRAPGTDPSKRRVYRLVRRDGADGDVTVGRGAEGVDVTIENTSVSTIHARFHPAENGWTVEDAGSTNGTFVDGDRVPAKSVRAIQSSSVVRLGPEARFTFYRSKDLEAYLGGLGSTMKDASGKGKLKLELPDYLADEDDEGTPMKDASGD